MTSTSGERRRPVGAHRALEVRTPVQTVAMVVAAVFVIVGVLGFVPGVTTDYDTLALAGPGSEALLLGVFQVSVLHNVVHLLFGVIGWALSRTAPGARAFLVGGGIVYLALTIYGWLVDQDSAANVVPLNAADDWLHLALGVGMTALGLLLAPHRRPSTVRGPTKTTRG